MQLLFDYLAKNNIQFNRSVSLKEISSFKIGGTADIVCYPENPQQVCEVVKFCNCNNIEYVSFGKCSNVVFTDSNFNKLIIKTDKLDSVDHNGDYFTFGSGLMLAKASKTTIDNSYEGMEFSYGIPGSVGGAVYMNAGAYGGQMSDIVYSTSYVDESGNIKLLEQKDHDFSYRHSFFSDKNFIILSTTVLLKKGDRQKSEEYVRELQIARKTKQPLEYPSAGSVFKRPEGYFAGKLIQDAGLKGFSIGGAAVSEKHSGFIINTGDATCNDVKTLVSYIKSVVFEKFGVELECELKFID